MQGYGPPSLRIREYVPSDETYPGSSRTAGLWGEGVCDSSALSMNEDRVTTSLDVRQVWLAQKTLRALGVALNPPGSICP